MGKRPSRKVGWAYWRLSALRSASDIVLASKSSAAGFTLGAVKALATSDPGQIDLMTLLSPLRKPVSVVGASVFSAVSSSVSSFARTRSATRELRFNALGRASAARLAREEDERVTATIAVGWAARFWKWPWRDTVHVGKPRQMIDSAEEIFFFGTVARISMFACWWDAKHDWKNIVFRVYGIKK